MTGKNPQAVGAGFKPAPAIPVLTSGSHLEKLLREGRFVVTAELGPPRGAERAVVEKKANLLNGYVDAVNITDCQTSVVRMSSIASAQILLEMGLEPVVQMTCRDRNRIALQSDLLGAWALGMKNLLCLTGDHPKFGDHPGAKPVFDLDSIHLLHMLKTMREEKKMLSGTPLEGEPRFFLGAAENPFADPFAFRSRRLAKKITAGAEFIQTQIVYNVDKFARWMEEVREKGLHKRAFILAGVTPLKSAGMAKYMKKHVPGMDVPDTIISRLEQKKSKAEGMDICVEIIGKLRQIEGLSGIHIMAIEWEEVVAQLVERVGLLPRPVASSRQ
ncbi:MAG TPA: methylenetetrahydrofolate reductase [Candidatus Tripitaka californicus]|uniref:methylenetetrahydrofolate reductase n=1 Tax=Candidatus Tripitaka californicus TaxID=3367616 RepID=UPI004027DE3A|nr:methylenetetrahydrofolate reductase [Planctomycetota bacterium]